jgi:signal transduction histidine kinase
LGIREQYMAVEHFKWLQFLDPRRYLAAAIGWAVLAVVTLGGFVAAEVAARSAEERVRAGSELLLAQLSHQTRHTLSESLANRLAVVRATGAQIQAMEGWTPARLRTYLAAIQAQFPEFAWLGIADANGRVVAATGGLLEGEDVSARPWFKAGARGAWLGDVHKALMLERHLPRAPDGQPLRFVDAAVPLADGAGATYVVGAHLSWHWIEALQVESLVALSSHRQVDVLLAAADGTVLAGPRHLEGRSLRDKGTDITEGGLYLTHESKAQRVAGKPGLDWSIVVRQRKGPALAAAQEVYERVFFTVLLAAFVAAALAILATHLLTRKLSRLAAHAQAVRAGAAAGIGRIEGTDEIATIGTTLASTVAQLLAEKDALRQLNAELDSKVIERTREIDRLAEENKHMSLVRERLRFARDLHDSLANSLLALLNEIRLMRLLRDKGRTDDFGERLATAEAAAARGLEEARASITQMRYNNLPQSGLAGALRDLLKRFSDRTGIGHVITSDLEKVQIPVPQAEVVFRITEEAVRNVERHSEANELRVALAHVERDAGAGHVTLTIVDDGVGFDTTTDRQGHYGLQGLREQAAMIGGELTIASQPGAGTHVTLTFPVDEAPAL